jgi:hypothetical protein
MSRELKDPTTEARHAGETVASGQAEKPGDLTTFVTRHDLQDALDLTGRLVSQHFTPIKELATLRRVDPENNDEWVMLRVTTGQALEGARQSYRRFLQEWLQSTPPETRALIRVTYVPG